MSDMWRYSAPTPYQGLVNPDAYLEMPDNAKRAMWNLPPLEDDEALTGNVWPLDTKPMEGRKDDGGKLPYDLIAPEFLTGTAEILAFGAAKYAPRNWEKGMAWSRPFAAMMRHMWAWWAGQGNDEETGKSHLWHAACCLMFLIAYEQRSIGQDDRPNSA